MASRKIGLIIFKSQWLCPLLDHMGIATLQLASGQTQGYAFHQDLNCWFNMCILHEWNMVSFLCLLCLRREPGLNLVKLASNTDSDSRSHLWGVPGRRIWRSRRRFLKRFNLCKSWKCKFNWLCTHQNHVSQPKQEHSKSTWNHTLQCFWAKYAAKQMVSFVWFIRSYQTIKTRGSGATLVTSTRFL